MVWPAHGFPCAASHFVPSGRIDVIAITIIQLPELFVQFGNGVVALAQCGLIGLFAFLQGVNLLTQFFGLLFALVELPVGPGNLVGQRFVVVGRLWRRRAHGGGGTRQEQACGKGNNSLSYHR